MIHYPPRRPVLHIHDTDHDSYAGKARPGINFSSRTNLLWATLFNAGFVAFQYIGALRIVLKHSVLDVAYLP